MNILVRESSQNGRETRHIVVLFGLGVIGGSIREHLIGNHFRVAWAPLMHWGQKEPLQKDLELLHDCLDVLIHQSPIAVRLSILWAAGKAGFSATEEDTSGEWIHYRQALALFQAKWEHRLPRNTSFYLISSAGGLFEGQRNVGEETQPAPMRPYGFLKLRQEKLLQEIPLPWNRTIYRLSSVYGYIEQSKRMGLIPTLLLNGIRYGVSHVLGTMSTLRDYIASEDVGLFLSGEIMSHESAASEKPVFLTAGKPTSILEVKALTERIIGRKLFISYDSDPKNAQDITFSAVALPKRWRPVDLGVGISRIYARYMSSCI